MINTFKKEELKRLYNPKSDSGNEDNGRVTIIGGSSLFHGAPLLSLKVASRMVDMVFFASPEPSVGRIAEKIKSKLFSFIWIPWDEVDAYIAKSDAVLIGPGLMRYRKESQNSKAKSQRLDGEGKRTREITEKLLKKFPDKRWVIDAGSLQVMEAGWIPEKAIVTPNKKEFEMLFGRGTVADMAKKYKCIIVAKRPETVVCQPVQAGSAEKCVKVVGGNAGLTKGGTGDVLAGLTVALLAQNDPFLAATSASYITKKAADELYEKVGPNYSADDLVDKIPEVFFDLLR